jgi:hypothetical protein
MYIYVHMYICIYVYGCMYDDIYTFVSYELFVCFCFFFRHDRVLPLVLIL